MKTLKLLLVVGMVTIANTIIAQYAELPIYVTVTEEIECEGSYGSITTNCSPSTTSGSSTKPYVGPQTYKFKFYVPDWAQFVIVTSEVNASYYPPGWDENPHQTWYSCTDSYDGFFNVPLSPINIGLHLIGTPHHPNHPTE